MTEGISNRNYVGLNLGLLSGSRALGLDRSEASLCPNRGRGELRLAAQGVEGWDVLAWSPGYSSVQQKSSEVSKSPHDKSSFPVHNNLQDCKTIKKWRDQS